MDSQGSSASDDAGQQANADDGPQITEGLEVRRGRRVPPMRPPEFVAPPVNRRRRSDWVVLLFALIVSGLVMAVCCIAGFALYTTKGGLFK
jgi:hypothetical protein